MLVGADSSLFAKYTVPLAKPTTVIIDELNFPLSLFDMTFVSPRGVQLIVIKKRLVIVLHRHSLADRFVKDNGKDKKHDYVTDRQGSSATGSTSCQLS